jgi:integrase/recombinase XerD
MMKVCWLHVLGIGGEIRELLNPPNVFDTTTRFRQRRGMVILQHNSPLLTKANGKPYTYKPF